MKKLVMYFWKASLFKVLHIPVLYLFANIWGIKGIGSFTFIYILCFYPVSNLSLPKRKKCVLLKWVPRWTVLHVTQAYLLKFWEYVFISYQ